MAHPYDVIVAGVGGMGAAACFHLARRGQRVLGLERFDIAHSRGSSHGITRIIRLAYYESPAYVPLVRRAFILWRELEQLAGESLLITTGGLDIGAADSRVFQGALATCKACDLKCEVLSGDAVTRRFPGYRLKKGHQAVFQPDAGMVLAERSLVGHVVLAQAAGAEIHAREKVLEWSPIAGGGVRVTTDRRAYEAGRLVVSAGAWVADLVPALASITVPERQVVGWFQPSDPAKFAPAAFPVSILDVEEGMYYALPVYGLPGLKIGLYHHLGERGHADVLSREATEADEAALRRGLAAYFPEANGQTMALATCLFTVTPDEHFIIDTLPGQDEVIVASPCSGHGYKFASPIGEIIADLATGADCAFDLSMFRIGRFDR
ncbi:MAG: N-methyl-L-tryptophan oxidase [Bauldia sp.]